MADFGYSRPRPSTPNPDANSGWYIAGFLVTVLAILGFIGFVLILAWNSTYVTTINGEGPVTGNIVLAAGAGVSVVDTTNTITLANTGVLTVDGQVPISGDILVTGGTGITISNGASNEIVVDNAGILSIAAGAGITQSTTDGVSTITDILSADYLLASNNVNFPSLSFYGEELTQPQNTWNHITKQAVGSQHGQGYVSAGYGWVAPAAGLYTFDAHCTIRPSELFPNDYLTSTLVLYLGGTEGLYNPYTNGGIIPAGGKSSMNLNGGTYGDSGPTDPVAVGISVGVTVPICPSCLVTVANSRLQISIRTDHTTSRTPPAMGAALTYAVIANTGVVNTGSTTVTGDMGIAPGSTVVNGPSVSGTTSLNDANSIAAEAAAATLYDALYDMTCTENFFTHAFIEKTDFILKPGVYCFEWSVHLGNIVLDGENDPNALFVFKIDDDVYGDTVQVSLINGAQPCGVFWIVGRTMSFTGTGTINGNWIVEQNITLTSGYTSNGALFSLNEAINLDTNTISAVGSCGGGAANMTTDYFCHLQASRIY